MNKFKLPRRDVPTIDSGRTITCTLTGESFPYQRHNPASRSKAMESAQDAGSKIIDANNERAGRKLSIREHQAMLEGKFSPDQRTMMEKILSDGVIKDNRDKTEDDVNGVAGATAAQLDNDKLYNTPARRAVRDKMKAEFQQQYESRQAELAEQAAKEAREADPMWRNALDNAEATLRLIRSNPAASEAEIAVTSARLSALQDGKLTVEGYWREVERAETENH